ncbi:hypothetical protein T03_12093 [Trichinella britovi]|uniref:Uncharacterized protein n=1 Tax=Trichinella britovi TaxID=45882 RepID=A0A0V1C456_TRIBR|nr:hypothetical protein T03_8890 [Trichinella britovi]KRY44037.1 hypothetical protein T03_13229 [Trichinella britovi]KRY44709.1 hypothetical protein T03_12093 [Trichinella britovi]
MALCIDAEGIFTLSVSEYLSSALSNVRSSNLDLVMHTTENISLKQLMTVTVNSRTDKY